MNKTELKEHLKSFILNEYGMRCTDYCGVCTLCQVWTSFDKIFDNEEPQENIENLFTRIHPITDTPIVNFLHLSEETGELAEEIIINSIGSYKKSEEGPKGEIADIIVCSLALWVNYSDSLNELYELMSKKITKWENNKIKNI